VTKTACLLTLVVTALTSMRRASLLGIIALGLVWTGAARAASNEGFLTWPGIPGTSSVVGHTGDIDIGSYSQNSSNNGGASVCGAITVTHQLDSASPEFLGLALTGQVTPTAKVTFAKPGPNKLLTYYTVNLTNVRVNSITQNDTSDGNIIETIIFTATQFLFTFTYFTPTGVPDSSKSTTFGWNCAANRRL
jgi:type VI protein secretion system component Hcp